MMGGARGMMFGDHAAAAEQWLHDIKAQLGITADQETVWKEFSGNVQSRAQSMNDRHREMAGGENTEGFIDHFDRMQAGALHLQSVASSARKLYASLTPEQKAQADSLIRGGCRF